MVSLVSPPSVSLHFVLYGLPVPPSEPELSLPRSQTRCCWWYVLIIAIFCCLSHFGVYWTSHPFGETGLLPRCICPHDHHSSRRTGCCSRWFDVLECLGTQATRSQGVA